MSVRGLDSLAEVIDLLKNPAKYDAKLSELRAEVGRYHAAIESVVKLDSVNEYTQNIRVKSAQVDELLETTQETTAKMLSDAKAEVEKSKAEAKSKKEVLAAKEKLLEEKLAKAEQEAAELAKEKLRQSDEQQALNKKKDELDALAKDLAERKAKLLAAIG
jgi:superfamily I DNA/RNA helicase